jgi:hypothetical protein
VPHQSYASDAPGFGAWLADRIGNGADRHANA